MDTKLTPWLLLVIAILVIAIIIMATSKAPPSSTTIVTETDTLYVTNTVTTLINREKVITEYDTVYVDGHLYGIARYKERIDTTKVSVDLDIAYWEYDRKFDVKALIDADIDTVYITKTTTINTITEKPYKAIAFTSGLSTRFKMKEKSPAINDVMADIGIRLNGRYDISLCAGTDEAFGIRLGIMY